MSIVAMKKLRLIAVRSQQEEILRDLMLLGCVEINKPTAEEYEQFGIHHQHAGGDLTRYRNERTKITNALRQLEKYAPEKKGLLTPLPEVEMDKLLDESVIGENLAAAEKISKLDERVRQLTAEESRQRAAIETLTPWKDLDYPLDRKETEYCSIVPGMLPVTVEPATAAEALAQATDEAEMYDVSKDENMQYMILVVAKDSAEAALSALRGAGWMPANLDSCKGTAAEMIAAGEAKLEALAEEKAGCVSGLEAMAEARSAMQLCADTIDTRIAREEGAEKLLNTERTFTFEGWLTAPDEKKLAETLEKYDCAWETEDPDPEHPEEVPVKLKNNKVTAPFNMVTEMYSLPAYNGLDPNPFIAPFFALFFGIMFADMAYGLILLAAGLLFTYKAKPRGTMKYMAGLLIECGITTTIIGFLTAGFFGDALNQIGSWFGKSWSITPYLGTINVAGISIDLPLDLLSGNNPLYVLVLAICLGAVHLFVGVTIGMYLKIRDGQWADAILNDFCWWVMIAGLGFMLLGKGTTVLWVGVGMMVLGSLITGEGFGKITGIVGAIYNGATGYLGDFLSYSRLMALMLAGSVIASVFNQLGSLGNKNGITVGGTILFILVFCIGHALNFGLNLIGCFVHTLRLQFLEFFGKWYRDGGRAFKPLAVSTKYVAVKEDKD